MKKKLTIIALVLLTATVLYAAWDSDTASTQLTTVSDTYQYFSQTPTTTPGEACHVQIEVDYAGTTDNLEVSVFGTLDDATENWDDTAAISFEMGRNSDPEAISFIVSGLYRFRVGVQSTGTTDDHTSVDMSHRCDGIDAS